MNSVVHWVEAFGLIPFEIAYYVLIQFRGKINLIVLSDYKILITFVMSNYFI